MSDPATQTRYILTRDFCVRALLVRMPAWNGAFQASDGKVYRAEQLFLLRDHAEAAGRERLQKRIDASKRQAARLAHYSRNLGSRCDAEA